MRKKIESNKKLLFWFSVDKTLYHNNFKHIAFFVTLSEGYKCNKLYEVTPKKRFLWESNKTNFKFFKFRLNFSHFHFLVALKLSLIC